MSSFASLSELEAKTELMRATMRDFCQHFVDGSPPSTLLDQCFTLSNPSILEHGPKWAALKLPFLNRTWTGRGDDTAGTCDDYFKVLAATLSFSPHENTIPPSSEFVIDAANGVGVVKADCKLASVDTLESWEEEFIFMFREFDKQGKIGRLEIWSDALSAWNAVTGRSAENRA